MNKIVPLWSVPRSISTGFERMMFERGDFKVIHEPFGYYFYLEAKAKEPVGMQPQEGHPQTFDGTVEMIEAAGADKPVFFKDMAYYVSDDADEDFMKKFTNTFIIRDPALTLVSYHKLDPTVTLREIGFESQFKLFELAKKITGEVPAVVDAEDLLIDAGSVVKQYCEKVGIPFLPESLTWEPEFKQEWKDWEMWHLDAGDSTGFQKDMEDFGYTVDDVPELREMYDKCLPLYEKMYAERLRPVTSPELRRGRAAARPLREAPFHARPTRRPASIQIAPPRARSPAVNRHVDPTPGQAGADGSGAPGAGECSLIAPFGGRLVDLVVHDPDERDALLERAQNLPVVPLSLRAQYDLEMLAVGAFSPLDRFMGRDEYESVLYEMHLESGELFPIPLAVPCREEVLRGHPRESRAVGRAGRHPGSARGGRGLPGRHPARDARGPWGQGQRPSAGHRGQALAEPLPGRPSARVRPAAPPPARPQVPHARAGARAPHGHGQLHRGGVPDAQPHAPDPRGAHQARARGGRRDAPHPSRRRCHPALRTSGAALRVEAYEVLVDNYYDPSRTLLSLMPLAMRFAGPREAVWHAIIRRNYGATHLIVGRDHAGPGPDSHGVPFYGPYDAQAMAEHYSHEIGVQDHPCAGARLPHRRGPLRGAQRGPLRGRASRPSPARRCARSIWPRASKLPEWFTRPEVAEVLQRAYAGAGDAPSGA